MDNLYDRNGPNHMRDAEQLGQYRSNSADATRTITMASSASFPTHTNMTDVFNRQLKNKVKLINKIVIYRVISYWLRYGSKVCCIGPRPKAVGQYSRSRTRSCSNNFSAVLNIFLFFFFLQEGGGGGGGGGGGAEGCLRQKLENIIRAYITPDINFTRLI